MQNPVRRAAACLIACAFPMAGIAAAGKTFVAPEARILEGGREVLVIVAQTEIKPNVRHLNAEGIGGLLPALIEASVNDARTQDAEKTIVPLREALAGFDLDPLMQEASSAALAGLPWFDVKESRLTKDGSTSSVVAAIDDATTQQLMVLRYRYETNPEFSQMVVSLDAQLVNKAVPKGKKPDARLQDKHLAYHQVLLSMVRLPNANDKDPAGNVKAWSADGGRAARAALELGVQRCQEMLHLSLATSEAELRARLKPQKPATPIPHVVGWELESPPGTTRVVDMRSGGFVQLETLGAAAAPPAK